MNFIIIHYVFFIALLFEINQLKKSEMESLKNIYKHPLISIQDLELIFKAHKKVFFKKGDYILMTGQIAQAYFCVEKGIVRTYAIDYRGNDITTGFIGDNEIVVDVFSLFHHSPAKEYIVALTDCEMWQIDFETFQELYHSSKGFNEWGRAWMSHSLFQHKQRIVSMVTESATERYKALIEERSEIFNQVPLKHVATYLGITDTSLSRIRKELIK